MGARALNDPDALREHIEALPSAEASANEPAIEILLAWCEGFSERGQGLLVPVLPVENQTDAELISTMVLDNEARRGDSCLNKALKMKRLLDATGDKTFVAAQFNFKATLSVDQHIKLLDMAKPVRDALHQGKVKMGRVKAWQKMSANDQIAALRDYRAQVEGRGGRNLRTTKAPGKAKMVQFLASHALKEAEGDNEEPPRTWTTAEVQTLVGYFTGTITPDEARASIDVIDYFLDDERERVAEARVRGAGASPSDPRWARAGAGAGARAHSAPLHRARARARADHRDLCRGALGFPGCPRRLSPPGPKEPPPDGEGAGGIPVQCVRLTRFPFLKFFA